MKCLRLTKRQRRKTSSDCRTTCSSPRVEPVQDVALITLLEKGGTSFVRAVPIQSPNAVQMKSLVHAYFVRYVLPNREKDEAAEEGETKSESGEGDETEDETQDYSEYDSDDEIKYERAKSTTSKERNGKGDKKKPDGIMKKKGRAQRFVEDDY